MKKKHIPVLIIVLIVIVIAGIFAVQKHVENKIRDYMTKMSAPYSLSAGDVSYSLFSNRLTMRDFVVTAKEPIFMEIRIKTAELSGFDPFFDEKDMEKPGIEMAKEIVFQDYSLTTKSDETSNVIPLVPDMNGTIKTAVYRNARLRPDATLQKLIGTTNPLEQMGMVEIDSIEFTDMAATTTSGVTVKVSADQGAIKEMRGLRIKEVSLNNYAAQSAHEYQIFKFGLIRVTDLNVNGILRAEIRTLPFATLTLQNVELNERLTADTFTIFKEFSAALTREGDNPHLGLRVDGLHLTPFTLRALFGDPEKLGYEKGLTLKAHLDMSYNPETLALRISDMGMHLADAFSANLAFQDFSWPITDFLSGGLDRALFYLGDVATLKGLTLSYQDDSFLQRYKNSLSPEERKERKQELLASLEEFPRSIIQGVETLWDQDGGLTVALTLPRPVSLAFLSSDKLWNDLPPDGLVVTNTPASQAAPVVQPEDQPEAAAPRNTPPSASGAPAGQ